MPLYCDFCGVCFTGAQWLCANCPALYCSARCKSSDSKEHSRVCSLQNGGDVSFSRFRAQQPQPSFQEQQPSFQTERNAQTRSEQSQAQGQESKLYHSRTFYSSKYFQSNLEGNFRNYPGTYNFHNTRAEPQPPLRKFENNVIRNNLNNNDGAEKNQQQIRGDRHVHIKPNNFSPPPAVPGHQTPQESKPKNPQAMKDTAAVVPPQVPVPVVEASAHKIKPTARVVQPDSKPKNPQAVKDAVIIPPQVPVVEAPSQKIKPTNRVVQQESKPKKPQTKKDPTVVPRSKTQNLYELLKSDNSSSDEESEVEAAPIAVGFTRPVHTQIGAKSVNEPKEVKKPLKGSKKEMKISSIEIKYSKKETKRDSKEVLKPKAKKSNKVSERLEVSGSNKNDESSGRFSKSSPVNVVSEEMKKTVDKKPSAEISAEERTINQNMKIDGKCTEPEVKPSNQLTKEEKKKQKKQRQREKAAQTNEEKFFDYVEAVKKEISLRNFVQAESILTEAFNMSTRLEQSEILYELRYRMSLTQEKYDKAIKDLKKLLEKNKTDKELLGTAMDCCMKTGNLKDFQFFYQLSEGSKSEIVVKAKERITRLERLLEAAEENEKKQLYSEAVKCLSDGLQMAPFSLKLYYWKAKLQALDKRSNNARITLSQSRKIELKVELNKAEFYKQFVIGLCSFYDGDIKDAEARFRSAQIELKEAEDWFFKARKMRTLELTVKNMAADRRYNAALEAAEKGLEVGEGNEKYVINILEHTAYIHYRLGTKDKALDCLNKVITMNPNADESLFHRGSIHMEMGDYEAAVRDLKEAYRLVPCCDYREELNQAEKLLKKSLAKDTDGDYYKTLGVERNASMETIKKAFKKKALECHPDKHANSTKEVKEENEMKMKELSQAYSCLSDAQKRKMYDADSDDYESDDEDMEFFFSYLFQNMGFFSFSFGGRM